MPGTPAFAVAAAVLAAATVQARAESGIASIYSGKRTACHIAFDPDAMTAAHRTLPCFTLVRVTTSAGITVLLTITDRGPYVAGRILDVSPAAARALGFRGLATVTLKTVR